MMELVSNTGAAGIDVTLHYFHVLKVVANYRSALAASYQLARLKAERAHIAHGASSLAFP